MSADLPAFPAYQSREPDPQAATAVHQPALEQFAAAEYDREAERLDELQDQAERAERDLADEDDDADCLELSDGSPY